MYIIPAIDLRGGKFVRLIQGDYERQIDYRDDPAAQAVEFAQAGARWLHVVDLDGAKAGRPVNTAAIANIAATGKLRIEVGGGIRDDASIEQLLRLGIERVIIGTKAVNDFEWFAAMASKYPGRLVLGLDARGATVSTEGWTQQAGRSLIDFAIEAAELPIAAIIYTDIDRDGMMSGPNLERTAELAKMVQVPVIASGGVKEIGDIYRLSCIGVEAVIVGRSLYEGTLNLADAIKATQGSA